MENLKQKIRELKEQGKKNKEISQELGISITTILYHLSDVYKNNIIQAGRERNKKLTKEQREKYNESRREYNKNYSANKYKNDIVFREKQKERARNRRKLI